MISSDDRNWAIYANAVGLLAFTNIPFITLLAAVSIWMHLRKNSARPFAFAHATFALRMQILWTGLAVAGVLLTFHDLRDLLITYVALCVLNAILSIFGCWRASDEKLPYA